MARKRRQSKVLRHKRVYSRWQRQHAGQETLPKTDAGLCAGGWSDVNITRRVRKVLGFDLDGPRMPKSFSGTFEVDGRRVRVYKSGQTPKGLLRMYMATDSGRMVPVGRVRQTVCKRRKRRK